MQSPKFRASNGSAAKSSHPGRAGTRSATPSNTHPNTQNSVNARHHAVGSTHGPLAVSNDIKIKIAIHPIAGPRAVDRRIAIGIARSTACVNQTSQATPRKNVARAVLSRG